MGLAADKHWASVSQASELQAYYRAELRRRRREERTRPVRMRFGLLLIRAGLRVATPLTVTTPVPPT